MAKRSNKKKQVQAPYNAPKKKVATTQPAQKKQVLHIGCGDKETGSGLHPRFKNENWQEIRLDISPEVKPDIVCDMTDMSVIKDNSYDAIWSSHNIEHIYAHQVIPAFKEFYRVLNQNGFALMATPDMQKVAEMVYKKGLEHVLYTSPSGPICGVDIFWGHRGSLANGFYPMAHKTGFTAHSLGLKLRDAGFRDIAVKRDGYNLWAIGYKRAEDNEKNRQITVTGDDVNQMMKERDNIDKEPELWKGFPPKEDPPAKEKKDK